MLALLLALALPAGAADHEISAELGWVRCTDPSWDLFSDNDGVPTRGFRGGVAVHDRVTVLASWGRTTRGATVDVADVGSFRSAYLAHTFGVGAKLDAEVGPILRPYVAAQGLAVLGEVRLDEDPDDDDNVGQVRAGGLAPGLLAAGGVELLLPRDETTPFTAAWYLELGYGATASQRFGDLGGFAARGLAVRSGVGLRF